ncbi:hypothetical protein [Paludisphaera soli]|uniref:hypothetical protein n=1 Tax=Paludisphaera soli TaxID=2712865 RepID=UPI0013EA7424|nr:hypothetical protein [Paludisphaera soli]
MIDQELLRRHKANRAAVAAAEKRARATRAAILAAGEAVEPGGYRLVVKDRVGPLVTAATVAEALGPEAYAELIEFLPTRETAVVTVATVATTPEAAVEAWLAEYGPIDGGRGR